MDYSKLSDDELRRVIAERLGYRATQRNTFPHGGPHYLGWVILDPDGVRIYNDFGDVASGPTEAVVLDWYLPEWATSVDIALKLPLKEGDGWKVTIRPDESLASIMPDCNIFLSSGQARDANTARAICLAWLAWKDSQE